MFLISTFYKVCLLDNYEDMKDPLLEECLKHSIKGTIILSEEGINATICGTKHGIDAVIDFINQDKRFQIAPPEGLCSEHIPFQRMKVNLKEEIVKLGVDGVQAMDSAPYIAPEEWDELIDNKNVHLIDTRNFYETIVGKFESAIEPNTENFRDFPQWFENWTRNNNISKKDRIAMYCTGGIRCEKSTAYLKSNGYHNACHLKGGILNYLSSTKNCNQKWHGDCFVFDDRVSLTYRLQPSASVKCGLCQTLVTTDDLKNVTRGQVVCLKCSTVKQYE